MNGCTTRCLTGRCESPCESMERYKDAICHACGERERERDSDFCACCQEDIDSNDGGDDDDRNPDDYDRAADAYERSMPGGDR